MTLLPAGDYRIEQHIVPGIMLIRSADCSAAATFHVNPVHPRGSTEKARLLFNKYGDRYFLAEVWGAGREAGRKLIKSRYEREVLMAGVPERVDVWVAARKQSPCSRLCQNPLVSDDPHSAAPRSPGAGLLLFHQPLTRSWPC